MRNDAGSSGDGKSNASKTQITRPWLLSVPKYTTWKRQPDDTANRNVDNISGDDARLQLESKKDPDWHTLRIPLERRKVSRLAVLSWSSEDEVIGKTLPVEIEALVEAEIAARSRDGACLGLVPRLIPLELKKRKRSDGFSPASLDSTPREPTEKSDAKKVRKAESMPMLLSLLKEQSTTPVEASDSAPEIEKKTTNERPSTETSNGQVQTVGFTRPESPPPMRILSVRSLADNSSYIYDPLDERIPVDVPTKNGDDQPPLYIFNPVKRYTDPVGHTAQNDVHHIVNRQTSEETSSDTRLTINASNDRDKSTARSEPATQSSQGSNLNVSLNDSGTAIFTSSANDGSRYHNGSQKVTQEIKAETEVGASIPLMRDTPPPVGKKISSPPGAPKAQKSSEKSEENDSVGVAGQVKGNLSASAAQSEEMLIYACTSNDVRSDVGFDPNSSPFGDSDENDDDCEKDRFPDDPIEPNFTSCVLRELDVNDGEPKEVAQRLAVLDHSYSKPHGENAPSTSSHVNSTVPEDRIPPQSAVATEDRSSIRGPTRLVVRLPRIANPSQTIELVDGDLPGRRDRKSSSSSSTDTSVGVSAKATHFGTSVLRDQKQDRSPTNRKVIKSEVILKKMQRITQKERSRCPADIILREKQSFLRKLGSYFRKNDFSKEPLNRSILNAIAEWLSPLANGKLPPSNVRNMLIDLIEEFTQTTPAQVFQTSSIEGVLILLMNHPQESIRNKRREWSIVNSWRDD